MGSVSTLLSLIVGSLACIHTAKAKQWASVCLKLVYRASDRVRQKMGNSAAFSREIMRQERSIMRQIMRFF